jgi:hypothetical protein
MLRVLNLGAGVQSTTLYLWAVDKQLDVDLAIFADTGDEPVRVYKHLDMLRGLAGPQIEIVKISDISLGEQLQSGMNADGTRHISIPAYLQGENGEPAAALGRRQCTAEYKIKPIDKRIRELVGLQKYQRSKTELVTQIFGLSFDEPKRVANTKDRFRAVSWANAEFPLFDEFMTRADCVEYLQKRLPGYMVPRSACVYCPFHSDAEWLAVKENPEDWAKALKVDAIIRQDGAACNSQMRMKQYLHKSCKPLDQVEFKQSAPDRQARFDFSTMDCEGMCGV